MDESQKEAVLQEFQKRIHPLIEAVSSFIDECGLGEKEKFSLSRIHSSFQTSISNTENAISNNQPIDSIYQAAENIADEFIRFIRRLNYFLNKDQNESEIPTIISDVQSKIQMSIDFLKNVMNPSSPQKNQEQNDNINTEVPEKKERKRRRRKNNQSSLLEEGTEEANPEVQIKESVIKNDEDPNENNQEIRRVRRSPHSSHRTRIKTDESTINEDSSNQKSKSINESIIENQEASNKANINLKSEDFNENNQLKDSPTNNNKRRRRHRIKNNQEQTQNDIVNIQNEQIQNDTIEIRNKNQNIQKEILNLNQNEIITINNYSELSNEEKEKELLNEIQRLNNEINTVNLRSSLLEKKLFELTQKSSDWTQSHIDEKCEDPEIALFDLLFEQQDTLNARIKKMSNLNDELNIQIEEENAQMNKIVRNNKNQEEEISKEIDDFIKSNSNTRLNKANLDKKYFDMKMEIHNINELFKKEQKLTENSSNRLSEMAEQISTIEASNEELKTKIKFYQDKCDELENEIDLMKSRKKTSQTEVLFQNMQDAEIDLLKTQKEYDILVNSTVPDLKYKLNKILEEISHLAAINRKEQEEAEFVNLQYIKDQVLNVFNF